MQSNVDEAIEVARTLGAELYPPGLEDLPFVAALERLGDRTQELTGLEVQVGVDEHAEPGSAGLRSFLYLGLRELLVNVVKHAETDRAWLRLRQRGDWLQAEVEDRGKGCDPEYFDRLPGKGTNHGASALRRRVELLGGRFEMASGNGCTVRLIVPVLR